MYRIGCCPLLDRELTLRGGVAEIDSVGVDVCVSCIRCDEDSLSSRSSNWFLESAGNSDGAGDGMGSKVTLMRSDRSFSRDFSSTFQWSSNNLEMRYIHLDLKRFEDF